MCMKTSPIKNILKNKAVTIFVFVFFFVPLEAFSKDQTSAIDERIVKLETKVTYLEKNIDSIDNNFNSLVALTFTLFTLGIGFYLVKEYAHVQTIRKKIELEESLIEAEKTKIFKSFTQLEQEAVALRIEMEIDFELFKYALVLQQNIESKSVDKDTHVALNFIIQNIKRADMKIFSCINRLRKLADEEQLGEVDQNILQAITSSRDLFKERYNPTGSQP